MKVVERVKLVSSRRHQLRTLPFSLKWSNSPVVLQDGFFVVVVTSCKVKVEWLEGSSSHATSEDVGHMQMMREVT